MRTSLLTLVVLAVSICASSGCGTVANFVSQKPKVYGGVEQDVTYFKEHLPCSQPQEVSPLQRLVILGIVPVEFCSTAIADTLTLPVTLALDDRWRSPEADRVTTATDCPVQYSTSSPGTEEPVPASRP
jgi:uncharacterized protein YceK